jgi:hypothetical protein
MPDGNSPYFASYDNQTGTVYVSNSGSNNISVIRGNSTVASVDVGRIPQDPTDSNSSGLLFVSNFGSNNVSLINGTRLFGTVMVGTAPDSAVCDSKNGLVYVPNSGSNNVTVIQLLLNVTISEKGLPAGYVWWANVTGGPSRSSNSTTLTLVVDPGTHGLAFGTMAGLYFSPSVNLSLRAWPVSLLARFTLVTFPVNFTESGLPAGTHWTVKLDGGAIRTTTLGFISLNASNGTYPYAFGLVPGWTTAIFSGSVVVNGRAISLTTAWTEVIYTATFTESGLPFGVEWWVNTSGGRSSHSTNSSLSFPTPNGTYPYSVSAANRSFAVPAGSFSVNGTGVFEAVSFTLISYSITFQAAGLPAGTIWSLTWRGSSFSTAASTQAFVEPNGTYSFVVGHVVGYAPAPKSGNITVDGMNVTQALVFASVPPTTYVVTFARSGLPSGIAWSVTFHGSMRSGTHNIAYAGIVNGSYSFEIGGVAGYTSLPSSGAIQVNGGNVTKPVAFTLVSSPPSMFLGLSTIEDYSLVAGIAIAVAVSGVILFRRKRQTPPNQPELTA